MIKKFNKFLINEANTCSRICKECPFSKNSAPGWLANYTVEDIADFVSNEALFPCHLTLSDDDLDQDEVETGIKNGDMKLCRGYVECVIKSAKSPRYNKLLIEEIDKVKKEGLSENSMPIWEFKKHHSK